MQLETIVTEIDECIMLITLNRHKTLNALNQKMAAEIISALREADKNEEVGCIIITGSEKAFAAGADISEFSEFKSKEAMELSKKGKEKVFDFIEEFSKPVIAAINGYALGGGLELALSCDIRIASNNALMGFPEASLGTIPGYWGTYRLAEIV